MFRPRWSSWITVSVALGIGTLAWRSFLPNLDLAQANSQQQHIKPMGKAYAAQDFIDTIGVVTHLSFKDNVYSNFDKIIRPRLKELGIRHIREGVLTPIDQYETYYKRCKTLAQDGIRFNLVLGQRAEGKRFVPNVDFSALSSIYRACGKGIVSFEGVNEPDIFGPFFKAPIWVEPSQSSQKILYQAVKGNALLSKLDVVSPSVTSIGAANDLGDLSAYTDYGNIHNYFAGRHPEVVGWGGAFQWQSLGPGKSGCRGIPDQEYAARKRRDPTIAIYGSIAFNVNCIARPITGHQPVFSTETGWDNAINSQAKFAAPVTEAVYGVYVPRLYLQHWNQGIARTFIYELADEGADPARKDSEQNRGLIRNDGSLKPAFYALKNLIQVLQDPGTSFQPRALNYRLDGNLADVQQALLQKSNGDYYLALWLGVSIWEPNQRKPISVPAQSITVNFSDRKFKQASRLRWKPDGSITISQQPIQAVGGRESKISLNTFPELTILKLSTK